jgi:hypothetical protein
MAPAALQPARVVGAFYGNQMRLVVITVAALMFLGVAALGLILAQTGSAPTAMVASTVHIASATPEVSAFPARAPVSQIAQATGSEVSPLILQANVDAQSGSAMTTGVQAPSAAAAAAVPNVKDQSPSTISKAMVHETTRLKDDVAGWGHQLQELELDLKLQLDLKNNQDVEATGKDMNGCLVVLRAAAGRLAPDAETRVTLRKQEVAVRDLAIRAEVHPDRRFRKTADYFQQKTTELLVAARNSKLLDFCCCAIAIAVRKASSAGAVFAASRFNKISPRMRCRKASVQCSPV